MALDPGEFDISMPPDLQEPELAAPASDERKFGLPFILNVPALRGTRTHREVLPADNLVVAPAAGKTPVKPTSGQAALELSKEEKKRRRTCKHDGCRNYIVHKGLCCRHGGGKKCSREGCDTSAKHRGLCWKHGGSVKCKENGCSKKAKARGLCWAHGGGTKCRNADCSKVAVPNGYCWAHGGGKRCGINGCIKPAYERTHNLCEAHYLHLRHADYFEV